MMAPLTLKCPVCGARFRAAATCSRCGTDLTMLMRIAAKAWAMRERSRSALRGGDLAGAMRWVAAAQRLHNPGPETASVCGATKNGKGSE